MRGAPENFGEFSVAPKSRTPVQIVAHMGDLMDWALGLVHGRYEWKDSKPLEWEAEVTRFFRAVEAFDRELAKGVAVTFPAERIFQGPIADALTHVGQIAQLRRLAGSPIKGESYFRSEISEGRVGLSQAPAVREFD